MIDLPIYPVDAPNADWSRLPRTTVSPFKGAEGWREVYARTGQELLYRLLNALQLRRSDQISILTTSNDTYVSTCVSLTAFNFAAISREITEKTRVVIVIHEFGYIYPELPDLCEKLRLQGITIIEDCAHILGADLVHGYTVGSFGDYSLFSLPKVLPLRCGGLLRQSPSAPVVIGSAADTKKDEADRVQSGFLEMIPFWEEMNVLRCHRYRILADRVGNERIGSVLVNDVPWMASIADSRSPSKLTINVQLGATLRRDILLIPTNPLVAEDTFERLADLLVADENQMKELGL